MDRRRAQVYVEADILDVNLDNSINFGSSLILVSQSNGTVQTYGWQGNEVAPIIAAGDGQNAALDIQQQQGIVNALGGQNFTVGVLAAQQIDIPGIGSVRPAGLISMLKADGNNRVPGFSSSSNLE